MSRKEFLKQQEQQKPIVEASANPSPATVSEPTPQLSVPQQRAQLLQKIEGFEKIKAIREFHQTNATFLKDLRQELDQKTHQQSCGEQNLVLIFGNDFDKTFIEVQGDFIQGPIINWDLLQKILRWETLIGIHNGWTTSRSYRMDQDYGGANANVSTLDATEWLATQGILIDFFILDTDISPFREELYEDYEKAKQSSSTDNPIATPEKLKKLFLRFRGKNPELIKLRGLASDKYQTQAPLDHQIGIMDDDEGIVKTAQEYGFVGIQVALRDEQHNTYDYEYLRKRAKLNGLDIYAKSLKEHPGQHKDDPQELLDIADAYTQTLAARQQSSMTIPTYIHQPIKNMFTRVEVEPQNALKSLKQLKTDHPLLLQGLIKIKYRGATLLGTACISGNAELVEFLLTEGANIHESSASGSAVYSPTEWAIRNGHDQVLEVLFKFGITINTLINDRTLLQLCFEWVQPSVLTFLLPRLTSPLHAINRLALLHALMDSIASPMRFSLSNQFLLKRLQELMQIFLQHNSIDSYIDEIFFVIEGYPNSIMQRIFNEAGFDQLFIMMMLPLSTDKRGSVLQSILEEQLVKDINSMPIELAKSFSMMMILHLPTRLLSQLFRIINNDRLSKSNTPSESTNHLSADNYRDIIHFIHQHINDFVSNVLIGGKLDNNQAEQQFSLHFQRLYVFVVSFLDSSKAEVGAKEAEVAIYVVQDILTNMRNVVEPFAKKDKRAKRILDNLNGNKETKKSGLIPEVANKGQQLHISTNKKKMRDSMQLIPLDSTLTEDWQRQLHQASRPSSVMGVAVTNQSFTEHAATKKTIATRPRDKTQFVSLPHDTQSLQPTATDANQNDSNRKSTVYSYGFHSTQTFLASDLNPMDQPNQTPFEPSYGVWAETFKASKPSKDRPRSMLLADESRRHSSADVTPPPKELLDLTSDSNNTTSRPAQTLREQPKKSLSTNQFGLMNQKSGKPTSTPSSWLPQKSTTTNRQTLLNNKYRTQKPNPADVKPPKPSGPKKE